MQPENGILIKSWYDDPHDFALKELGKLLVLLATENVQDVRPALRKYREQLLEDINAK